MRIATVVGARPQFIKAVAVQRAIAAHNQESRDPSTLITEILVHTGQHYDDRMSDVFFRELELPLPKYNLGVGSGSHGVQTGLMLMRLEEVLLKEVPDWVLVYGDTNSTLAGALAAAKLNIPVVHIEAGLRSYNRRMPEEINRIATDRLSTLLFCPTETAVRNLQREGITEGVQRVGDVMVDQLYHSLRRLDHAHDSVERPEAPYAVCTIHRAENTDDPSRLGEILHAVNQIADDGLSVVMPLHPRTRGRIETAFKEWVRHPGVLLREPVSYLEMLCLVRSAQVVLTDSGGLQKEAYLLGVPCATLRDETEWVETVEAGWNVLCGAVAGRIRDAVRRFPKSLPPRVDLFGGEGASERIVSILLALWRRGPLAGEVTRLNAGACSLRPSV